MALAIPRFCSKQVPLIITFLVLPPYGLPWILQFESCASGRRRRKKKRLESLLGCPVLWASHLLIVVVASFGIGKNRIGK